MSVYTRCVLEIMTDLPVYLVLLEKMIYNYIYKKNEQINKKERKKASSYSK